MADVEGAAAANDAANAALVSFLRAEADLSAQKAISLRAQADQLAADHGITEEAQQRYELDPSQLAPLDDQGLPKYKGKKRGRKPKERKRKANPQRRRRQHTAYTLFVQENYPRIKQENAGLPSKELISIVARQWAAVDSEEKRLWKERALATHEDDEVEDKGDLGYGGVEDEEDEDEEEDGEDDEDEDEGEDEEDLPKSSRVRR